MARFDVYHEREGKALLLDCQSDLLDHFETRFVVPLLPVGTAEKASRLHPIFSIDGQDLIMATQLASAVNNHDLGKLVSHLRNHHDRIIAALDMLISGY